MFLNSISINTKNNNPAYNFGYKIGLFIGSNITVILIGIFSTIVLLFLYKYLKNRKVRNLNN